MIDISLRHIKKTYGENTVLKDVNMEIQSGEKVGLIGQNGSGKTTIFRIIAGREERDEGSLFINADRKIGYLEQIPEFPDSYTVTDALNSAFSELIELKRKMAALEHTFAENHKGAGNAYQETDMETYGKLQSEFEQKGGYKFETDLEKICTGLKLSPDFRKRQFRHLSSGEKSIVVLGKLLLASCDILLLDEPTNHLDFEAIEWLEAFLMDFTGCVVIISHDRYFLDKSVTKIVELEGGRTEVFHGHYSYYVAEKDRQLYAQFEQYKNQEKKIKAMEAAVKRFREWGRRSDDPRMFRKAANMEKRIEKMEKIDKPVLERKKIKLNHSVTGRSGKNVVEIRGLSKSFGDALLLKNLDALVRYRERAAILGKNGSGKSTIFKLLLGLLQPDQGKIRIGSRVKIGYLEQEVSFPHEDRSILDELRTILEVDQGTARAYLAKVLFFKEDVFKTIKQLSGGELVRLKLCLLMHQEYNFLLLDEPTNHLDIDSREVFEEFLGDFKGTILFISHDRYFINKIANRILSIENNTLVSYPGNYSYFKEKKALSDQVVEKTADQFKKQEKESQDKKRQKNKAGSKNRKKNIETEMTFIESEILKIDEEMEKNPTDYEMQNVLFLKKEKLRYELENLFDKLLEMEG